MLAEVHFGESTRAESLDKTIVPELLASSNMIDHGIASLSLAV